MRAHGSSIATAIGALLLLSFLAWLIWIPAASTVQAAASSAAPVQIVSDLGQSTLPYGGFSAVLVAEKSQSDPSKSTDKPDTAPSKDKDDEDEEDEEEEDEEDEDDDKEKVTAPKPEKKKGSH